MAYLKMNGTDFSHCVNALKVNSAATYNAQTNAAGDTVVDYINHKRTVEVGIIPLTQSDMNTLQAIIKELNVSLSFANPQTGELLELNCILPESEVEYYTIQADKVLYKAFTLTFIEL